MRIKGMKPAKPQDFVVITRGLETFEIKLVPVDTYEAFNKYFREPEPPLVTFPGKGKVPDFNDINYRDALSNYRSMRSHYIILRTLREANIEWEKVNPEEPTTWEHLNTELAEWLLPGEISYLSDRIANVNALNDVMLEESRRRFLAGMETGDQ